jgi:hypothetical protein
LKLTLARRIGTGVHEQFFVVTFVQTTQMLLVLLLLLQV